MKRRRIRVAELARVEGEGALDVRIRGGKVESVALNLFEAPRLFEAFLRGRSSSEAPDLTARICGICPVAYQMSASHAVESALGLSVAGPLRALRRLLYCGEWIQSHALHVFLLHAPDFLGCQDAIEMAREHRDLVERGLRLKKTGNEILALLGGRAVHPVNVRVGGFYRVPTREELERLVEPLEWAREAARDTVRFTAALDFPPLVRDIELVALRHPEEYPMNEGRLVSTHGLDIAVSDFEEHFVERQVDHSNALHGLRATGESYSVGPLARFVLNYDRLSPLARHAAEEARLGPDVRNPFRSIVVRAVEILYACDEALRIIEDYAPPDAPSIPFAPGPGEGAACTEAPRGILYHRYRLDADGLISEAKIVPPTSQNQRSIELDLEQLVTDHLDEEDERLQWLCEQTIRSYDPCISCATHFLRLRVDRD